MQVSESAYHAYARGKSYALSPRKAALAALVKETFYLHRRRYGARRIAAHLKAQGQRAGRCAVRTADEATGVASHPATLVCAAHDRLAARGRAEFEPVA
jgi:hypothetical protein